MQTNRGNTRHGRQTVCSPEPYLTVREAAKHLDVLHETLRARIAYCRRHGKDHPFERRRGDTIGHSNRRHVLSARRDLLEAWASTYE